MQANAPKSKTLPATTAVAPPTNPLLSVLGWVQEWPVILLNLAARWIIPTRRRSRYFRSRRRREIEHWCCSIPEGETIFVSVASYRDRECPETVFDIFEKAACPFRIFVGV